MAENKEILDSAAQMSNTDPSNMMGLVDGLTEMFEKGWKLAEAANIPATDKIDKLIVCGMGGSAISGDIAAMALKNKADFPVLVNRSYSCPRYVGASTLMIFISYSGNTEETISTFKEAVKKGVKMMAISSGGQLKELAAKNNVPLIEVPKGLPPRSALGYLLSSLLCAVYRSGLAGDLKNDFDETAALLKRLHKKFGAASSSRENEAKQMAVRLSGKLPVIMASEATTAAAALRWKTQLNENSKMTALLSIFPELNHNDMVNFSFLKPGAHEMAFVLLRDETDPERMKKRIEITKSLISGHVGGITEVWSQGESALARTMSLILFGDYLSLYLAALGGVDPTPVDIIEKLKKELGR